MQKSRCCSRTESEWKPAETVHSAGLWTASAEIKELFVAGDAAETPGGCGERKHTSATHTHTCTHTHAHTDRHTHTHSHIYTHTHTHTHTPAKTNTCEPENTPGKHGWCLHLRNSAKEDAWVLLRCSELCSHARHPTVVICICLY